jgi:hypothetical protein
MATVVAGRLPSDGFVGFDLWFEALVERTCPDIVIAVARGAARLLQLHGIVNGNLGIPVFSHHALPFLGQSELYGRRVLLFDDSVIYGSTMADVGDYLTGRGCLVIYAAYVADRQTFFGEGTFPPSPFLSLKPQIQRQLAPDDVPRHHAGLVQEIFDSGLDLNLAPRGNGAT